MSSVISERRNVFQLYLNTRAFNVPRSCHSLQVNFARSDWQRPQICSRRTKGKRLKKVWIEKQRRLKNFSTHFLPLCMHTHTHTQIYRYIYIHSRYIDLYFVLKYSSMRPWSKHNTRSIDYVLVSIFCRYGNEIRSLLRCPSEDGDDDDDGDASASSITGRKMCYCFACV